MKMMTTMILVMAALSGVATASEVCKVTVTKWKTFERYTIQTYCSSPDDELRKDCLPENRFREEAKQIQRLLDLGYKPLTSNDQTAFYKL